MAPHSSTLAWKIRWTEEPGRLQSMGSLRVDTTEQLHFHALEKEMATLSSVLAWRIPGTGEPGGLLSMGSHRVEHEWSDLAAVSSEVRMNEKHDLWRNNTFPLWLCRFYCSEASRRVVRWFCKFGLTHQAFLQDLDWPLFDYFIFYLFLIEGKLPCNIVISAIYQHESAIHIYVSLASWTSLPPSSLSNPSRLSQSPVWFSWVVQQTPTGSLFYI